MTMKFNGNGRKSVLNTFTAIISGHLSVGLFTNNYTPAANSDLDTDLAGQEPAYTGYARQSIGAFGAATDDGTSALIVAPPLLFGPTADGVSPTDIYGYFVYHGDGYMVSAERFADAPRAVQNVGDYCPVVPKISLNDQ